MIYGFTRKPPPPPPPLRPYVKGTRSWVGRIAIGESCLCLGATIIFYVFSSHFLYYCFIVLPSVERNKSVDFYFHLNFFQFFCLNFFFFQFTVTTTAPTAWLPHLYSYSFMGCMNRWREEMRWSRACRSILNVSTSVFISVFMYVFMFRKDINVKHYHHAVNLNTNKKTTEKYQHIHHHIHHHIHNTYIDTPLTPQFDIRHSTFDILHSTMMGYDT